VKFRIGVLTFDPDTRQLLGDTGEVHVSPKAFDLLRVLVEQRPRAISKADLHQRLWPETFVSDANLASLVAELRQALDDDARAPRFIRTAHRYGYAFCGEATPQQVAATAPADRSFCWLLSDGRRLPLRNGENVLGRDEDGIQIDSPTVSRRHARITIAGETASIEDLGSKNGTFVGGEPVVERTSLVDGDEIRAGSVRFRFRMALPQGRTATWNDPA
jgi:DNA-binding winged helix-turn-helix (wHTH) protein